MLGGYVYHGLNRANGRLRKQVDPAFRGAFRIHSLALYSLPRPRVACKAS